LHLWQVSGKSGQLILTFKDGGVATVETRAYTDARDMDDLLN